MHTQEKVLEEKKVKMLKNKKWPRVVELWVVKKFSILQSFGNVLYNMKIIK